MDAAKADMKFTENLKKSVGNKYFATTGNGFMVKHYAGPVNYNANGFTDRNKDILFSTIIECMQNSSDTFLRSMFPEDTKSDQSKKKPTTSGFKIKVDNLLHTNTVCLAKFIAIGQKFEAVSSSLCALHQTK